MLSDNSIKRILKKAGALRISKKAIKRLKKKIEEEAMIVARKAVKNSQYSGRRVVKVEDIAKAMKD